ncbi:hypothetical protein [Rhizobium laguerreae]|uniref:hypothetical protein n=1 Tax=Rhizobium laguerreae TaxID=1076926 RepID=UPI001C91661E|nr:hypothetical protein [Rhizobium laguerreae]MBY3199973.1 hypothetical protein [Rhizobium laguerreae]
MRHSILAALVGLLVVLAGCVSAPPDATQSQALTQAIPSDYKAQIKERLKTTLVDPYSLRDIEMTAPQAIPIFGGTAPGVCLRFNPKNNYGAYNGMESYIIYFVDGKMRIIDHPKLTVCGPWRPAPELAG